MLEDGKLEGLANVDVEVSHSCDAVASESNDITLFLLLTVSCFSSENLSFTMCMRRLSDYSCSISERTADIPSV